MPQLQPHQWVIVGIGALIFLVGTFKDAILDWFKQHPLPIPVLRPDPLAAYATLKRACANCPEAIEALKVVWVHLEPIHTEGPK